MLRSQVRRKGSHPRRVRLFAGRVGAAAGAVTALGWGGAAHAALPWFDLGEQSAPLQSAAAAASGSGLGATLQQGLSCIGMWMHGSLATALMQHGSSRPHCAGLRMFDLALVGLVGLIIVAALRLRHDRVRRQLDLAWRMVDQGLEPPAQLLIARSVSDLRRGLILSCLGIGVFCAQWFEGVAGGHHRGFGLVPLFIGIGYLLSHLLAQRSSRDGLSPEIHRARGGGS